jgi:hypothetical protein
VSGRKMFVTTVQENCICKTKVHLLVFNIFYALLGYLDRYIRVAVLYVNTPVSCSTRLHLIWLSQDLAGTGLGYYGIKTHRTS